MKSNSFIRLIQPEDDARMGAIIREVMTEFQTVGPGYSINDPEVDHMHAAYNDPQRSRYFVLEVDGVVQGGAGIAPLENGDAEVCELRKMYFLPSVRGQGWGKKIVQLCLDTARKIGYKKCYLETVERMETANLLYRKMGFEALCGRMGDTGHGGCDAYFVKELVQ